MSKLAHLLNPAPSGSATSQPPPIHPHPPHSNSLPHSHSHSHRRNESITSPLEALALAATTASPLQPPVTAIAAPPTSVSPSPYTIKTQNSPPPAAATSAPTPHSPAAKFASLESENGLTHTLPASPPTRSTPSFTQQPSQPETTQSIAKTDMSDESAVVATSTPAVSAENEQPVMSKSPPVASPLPSATPLTQPQDTEMKDDGSVADVKASVELTPAPAPVPTPKKAVQKKGTAKKTTDSVTRKAAPKKRKLEPESKDGTPFSQRSDTPASRLSKTPARKNTPQQSSPPPSQDNASVADEDADGGDYVDENELFCVCRKPDDHTWMIGCDGGCDDWFHGHCVNMKERDSELIDKYVCPRCEAAGRGKTMWKPMCRLESCRAPARVSGKNPSKYCSDDHGVQFMKEKVYGKHGARGSKDDAMRKRRRRDKSINAQGDDGQSDGASSDDGHQAHLRGGVLKPGELKALVAGSKDVVQFKRLGERTATPDTMDKTTDHDGDVKMTDGESQEDAGPRLQLGEEDQAKFDEMTKQKTALESELRMLGDKEKFLNMVKARHKSVLDEMKKKEGVKDICGYDSRLTWSEPEFDDWRQSEEGKQALESKVLGPPTQKAADPGSANGTAKDDAEDEIGKGVCKKKRCERHKQWAKMEQNEINLARSQCWHNMRKLEGEEAGLKERAMIRQLEAAR